MDTRVVGRTIVTAALMLLCSAGAAQASIIVNLINVVSNGSGGFTWTYQADLTTGEVVQTGPPPGITTPSPGGSGGAFADYFTVYDFAGFTGTTTQPSNWTFQTLPLGSTPSGILPNDDSLLPNLTWYLNTGFQFPGTLGTFTADSDFGTQISDTYAADATLAADGSAFANSGAVNVPNAPEPGSLLLVGGGLLVLSLYRRLGR